MSRIHPVWLLAVVLGTAACGDAATPPAEPADPSTGAARVPNRPPVAPSSGDTRPAVPRIVFLGDSLTAGLGLEAADSYPSLVQRRLDEGGYHYQVVNAGVSGDTSAGGRRRLDWSLDGDVRILVLALGANDGLRGLPVDELEANLAGVIERAQVRGIAVILAGMEAPPNNGPDYTARFRAVYPKLAREYKVGLIPFLLQGVAGEASLNQADGIHPNVRGARIVAEVVWAALEPALTAPAPIAR